MDETSVFDDTSYREKRQSKETDSEDETGDHSFDGTFDDEDYGSVTQRSIRREKEKSSSDGSDSETDFEISSSMHEKSALPIDPSANKMSSRDDSDSETNVEISSSIQEKSTLPANPSATTYLDESVIFQPKVKKNRALILHSSDSESTDCDERTSFHTANVSPADPQAHKVDVPINVSSTDETLPEDTVDPESQGRYPRMSENIKFAMSSTILQSNGQEINEGLYGPPGSPIVNSTTSPIPSHISESDVQFISDSDDEESKRPTNFLKQFIQNVGRKQNTEGANRLQIHKAPKPEYNPHETQPKPPSPSQDSEVGVVLVELEQRKETIVKHEDDFQESELPPLKKETVVEVTPRIYKEQQDKILALEHNVQKAKQLLRSIDLNALPDKGKAIHDRYEEAANSLKLEKERIGNMVMGTIEPKITFPPDGGPKAPPPVPPTWKDLKAASTAVQPRTFGKQALATHNQQKTLTLDRLHQLHGSLKSCPTEDIMADDPKGLKVELMPHQKHAVAWLMWREQQKPSGGILADDMGLGKTLTMIALLMKAKEAEGADSDSDEENVPVASKRHKYSGQTLIICPASLLSQWDGEVRNRVQRGLISTELYHGPKRETRAKMLARYDMVITTYSIVMNEHEKNTPLFNIKWKRIIMDEAHQVRNYKSRTSIAVCELAATSRWVLTGTPIHNKEVDLYALLKFLRCSPFDDLPIFKRWATEKNAGGQQRLHTVMSSLMLRRTKSQLQELGTLQCLPERRWDIVEIVLEKEEMNIYQRVLIFSKTLFAQFLHQRAEKNEDALRPMDTRPMLTNDPKSNHFKMHQKLLKMNGARQIQQAEILVLLLRLRQICCHPSLITGMLQGGEKEGNDYDEEEDNDTIDLMEQLNNLKLDDEDDMNVTFGQDAADVGLGEATRRLLNPASPVFNQNRKSSKIRSVIKLLEKIPNEDKSIIVSQWTGLLKLLGIHLRDRGIRYEQLDGSVPVNKRPAMIDNFNDPRYPAKILLLSLTAGGVGLNLVGANHLLLLDLHWNPQLEMQAQDRIYRVGQKKTVHVYKFMAMDTIEERIKKLQDYKKGIAENVLSGGKVKNSKLSLDDLKMLFEM